jgi:hypothetical protein
MKYFNLVFTPTKIRRLNELIGFMLFVCATLLFLNLHCSGDVRIAGLALVEVSRGGFAGSEVDRCSDVDGIYACFAGTASVALALDARAAY